MCMKTNIKLAPLRFAEALHEVYVVQGDGKKAGHVTPMRFHSNVVPHVLHFEFTVNQQNRRNGIRSIQVKQVYLDRGWRLLRDCYEEEGRLDDYEIFLDFIKACKEQRVHPQKKPKGKQEIVPGFPNRLLPKYVRDLASGATQRHAEWEPPEQVVPKAATQ